MATHDLEYKLCNIILEKSLSKQKQLLQQAATINSREAKYLNCILDVLLYSIFVVFNKPNSKFVINPTAKIIYANKI